MRFGPTIAAIVFVLAVGLFAPISPWLVMAGLVGIAATDRAAGRIRRSDA